MNFGSTTFIYFLGIILNISRIQSGAVAWSDKEFDDKIQEAQVAFVKFYAPWCGHCKRLAPDWDKLADDENTKIPIVKVDCTTDGRETCERYKVAGFPTLKLIMTNGHDDSSKHTVVEYEEARNIKSLKNFILKHTQAAFVELTAEQVNKFINEDEVAVFLAYYENKGSDLAKAFSDISKEHTGRAKFGVITDKKVASAVEKIVPETVTYFKPVYQRNKLEDNSMSTNDIKDLKNFVLKHILSSVIIRNDDLDKILVYPVLTVFLKSSPKADPSVFKMVRNRLFGTAKKFPDFTFAVASKADYKGKGVDGNEPITDDELFISIQTKDGKKYFDFKNLLKVNKINLVGEACESLVNKFKVGELEEYIKSESSDQHDDPQDHSVKVTGKNFDKIVMNGEKDVLLFIYAPWCGHCNNLKPIYNEVAEKFKGEDHLVIAKIDATQNDIPTIFDIRGYPTIYLQKMDKSVAPIKFNGDRTVEGFTTFLEKHVTKQLKHQKEEL